ncbi:hypothetical protein MFLAVUS_009021 [Mucor flavus]|uniref:Uncharacterized protein n=1 Tax=Mucor flavus TaxID=439312 RepID=A0ABP9Z8T7_9FUNG
MPPISRPKKNLMDTSSKKIDSYFKPVSKAKRKVEHDENCQENVRPSPSPPNSQQRRQDMLKPKDFGERTFGEKTFGEKTFGEKTFGEKTFGEKTFGEKTFGEKTFGTRSDKENIGSSSSSKPFGLSRMDRENNGCKTFSTTNALMWQKFDRQPLREKSIKPVNTLKSGGIINKPVLSTFNVLSDKDIENGLEDSIGSSRRSEDGELNTQYVEEGGTLDSNYSIASPISYPSDNDTNDTFKPYADQDQISEYVVSDDITNPDEFDTQEEKIDVYRDDDDESETFTVYVDKDESSSQAILDVYRDDVYEDGPETFNIYTDNDEPETFKVYVDNDESNSKDEGDSDSNDTTTFKVYVDSELRKDKFTEHKDTQEQQSTELSDSKASPSAKGLQRLPCLQSFGSMPDFFNDDEDKGDTGSTFGKGIFDDEEEEELAYGSISIQSEDFSINDGSAESLGPAPEFKEPIAPIFSLRYKQLLKEREQTS